MNPGDAVGAYRVLQKIGEGGMGEVYRATDANLGRDVAIKVLPPEFARDPERLARFEREARTLASLSHPNIAIVHGLEKAGPIRALVMELVDGATLADRIAAGPMPLDEALPIATQIAEALEAAHEQGIIHRDLKPANIKVRPDGTVKVLDFGLAKVLEPAVAMSPGSSMPPTITTPAMTQLGVILGTAAYMSPEQAKGRGVDKRSDIWAFGCVLFEMLSGTRAFAGDDVSDTLAAILRGEPEWNALPSETPPHIERLLRRCLERDPKKRLQAIGDARLELEDQAATLPGRDVVAPQVSPRTAGTSYRVLAAAMAATALVSGIAAWMLKPAPAAAPQAVTRSLIARHPFDLRAPSADNADRAVAPRPSLTGVALSPDGRTLVLRALGSRATQLFMRPLDRLEFTPIPGTEGGELPFFSPDGVWVGFWKDGDLFKVPVAGGPASVITRVRLDTPSRIMGASWGDGDVIVFATTAGLWRVAAAGGQPQSVTTLSKGEAAHRLPHVLPGGKTILYTVTKEQFRWDNADVVVRSLENRDQKVVVSDAADARYMPSGHILFARRGSLVAAPFDLDRLEMRGGGVTVVDSVMQAINQGNPTTDSGAAQFAVSPRGTLVYVTGDASALDDRILVWTNRDGTGVDPLPGIPPGRYLAPRLSPDGTRVVVYAVSSATVPSRVWTYDLARRTFTPLTAPEERGAFPIWSPDGSRIAFLSDLGADADLFMKPSFGGPSERLTTGAGRSFPSSWTPDGKKLIVIGSPLDIRLLDLDDSQRRTQPIMQGQRGQSQATLSRDGRWLAFTANDSGRNEVYVQPFPGSGPRRPVSTEGGHSPAWNGAGTELFYLVGNRPAPLRVMSVSIGVGPTGLSMSSPRKLFERPVNVTIPVTGYDVTPDGKRFLLIDYVNRPQQPDSELVLVERWFDELKRQVPTKSNR